MASKRIKEFSALSTELSISRLKFLSMKPTGIEQPCNRVFQLGRNENLSDLDAGDPVLSGDVMF